MPLQTRFLERSAGLDGCVVDLRRIATEIGLKVRSPRPAEPSWLATLQPLHGALRVSLQRPDGALVASKTAPATGTPCKVASELLAILLAAHVPEVQLALPPRPAPVAEKPLYWRAALGGGVSGFAEGSALLVTASSQLRLWRSLGLGARLAFVHQQQRLEAGSARIWSIDAQASAGYLSVGSAVSWAAGGLLGSRVSHATASGLAVNSSATVPSLSVGLFVDHWWSIARRLAVGAGVAVLWLLPRAAFTVTNQGTIFQTPAPTVDLHLTIGWGA